ncbi:MAG: hypothetical protein K0R67_3660, partial [Paenibacillus sp.]|nr:hypothetical protein [Paenibacillus sp.]
MADDIWTGAALTDASSSNKAASEPLQSVRWAGEHLDLLDQRLLPEEIVYLQLTT